MAARAPSAFPSATHPVAVPEATAVAPAAQDLQFDRLLPRRRGPRMVPNILTALAATMNERGVVQNAPGATAKNSLSAGHTYLGQLIDHDLTFDKRLFSMKPGPTRPVKNLRTPRFDLDSLYGDGPLVDKPLYESDGISLKVGAHDLRRRPDGEAYIKDRRNDSNRIVSQLHFAMAAFHNRIASQIAQPTFRKARDEVRRHYQWIVLHEFLERVVGKAMVDSILGGGPARARAKLKLVPAHRKPRIPFEFSAAAFRFGHTMVRAAYALNGTSGQFLTFDAAHPQGTQGEDLRGFRPMPAALAIDWDFFFPRVGADPAVLQLARPINTLVAGPLFEMPIMVAQNRTAPGRRLPFRNLHRSEIDLQLATGQEMAMEMRRLQIPGADGMKILGVDVPLEIVPGEFSEVGESTSNLGLTGIDLATLQANVQHATPLWYYILKEAEVFGNGRRLGFVGGRIVAEVFIATLLSDPTSILSVTPRWQPHKGTFGCRTTGEYRMSDLLFYAGGRGP